MVIYQRVMKSDLILMFGINQQALDVWLKAGLPCEPDGTFILSKSCHWIKEYYQEKAKRQIKPNSLSQQQLADLFNVTRQTITAWGRAGLPRRSDETYNLKDVIRWLRSYYQQIAKKEYTERLYAIQKKLCRNVRQLEIFIEKENHI